MANKPSLSSVVSNLVRAQMGSSLPANTLDEELDRRVAELILKEARQKETRYAQTGSYATPVSSGNAARPNKRFLSSIIKSTDEHNKNVLRAQAEAANESKQQREREEREERMRRAREAASARSGSLEDSWKARDRHDSGSGSISRRKRSRSRDSEERYSGSRRERKRHHESDDEDASRRSKRRREDGSREKRSPSPSSRSHRHRERSRDRDEDHDRHSSRKRNEHGKDRREEKDRRGRDKSRSRSPKRRKPQEDDGKGRSNRSRDDKERRRSKSKERERERVHKTSDQYRPSSKLLAVALGQSRNQSRGTSASVDDITHTSNLSSNNTNNSPRTRIPTNERKGNPSQEHAEHNLLDSDDDIGPKPLHSNAQAKSDKKINNHNDDDDGDGDSNDNGLPQYSSKMDKYFSRGYDPRLDVASAVENSDGLIPPDAFDNWNYMLEVVKKRREEKEERKRLEKLYAKDSKPKKSKKDGRAEGLSAEMTELMSMQYTKRGGVREWDEGKKEAT